MAENLSDIASIYPALSASYLCADMTEQMVTEIAMISQAFRYADGEVILSRQDHDQTLYVVASGTVSVHYGDDDGEFFVVPGGSIGEMAFLDDKPRSATVKSKGVTVLIALQHGRLSDFLGANPVTASILYRNLAKAMCARLRTTNRFLEALRPL